MPTTTITNLDRTRLKDILSKTATYEQRFLYQAISALLESQIGVGATDDIIDGLLPTPANMLAKFGGREIGFYSGLSRIRLKAMVNLDTGVVFTDGNVDSIFTALGVVEV